MDREADAQASVRRRGAAYVLDAVVVSTLAEVIADRISASEDPRLLTATLAGVLATIYHVVLEGATGQTIGKRLVGIAVVDEAGGPITVRRAGIRTAFRGLDWLPVGYFVGIAAIHRSSRGQRVGDRVAGTVVVRTDAGVGVREGGGSDERCDRSERSEVVARA